MLNYWSSESNNLVAWNADLEFTDSEGLLKFCESILVAGQQNGFLSIIPKDATRETNTSYLDAVKNTYNTNQHLILGDLRNENWIVQNQVCYYDIRGNIVEEYVSDIGELLASLRPDRAQIPYCRHYAMSHRPLIYFISLQKDDPLAYHFSISTGTSIWFPTVIGYLDEDEELGFPDLDNREIAHCNTSRLNRFLLAMRNLTENAGGKWSMEVDQAYCPDIYGERCSINGIDLS